VNYFADRVTVITGAGSGIGRALAVALAGQGAVLALSDRDGEAVTETRCLCRGAPAARVDAVDVTDWRAVSDYASAVRTEFDRVDVVLAVAGVIHTGSVVSSTLADMQRVMDVDYWGVVHTAKSFLPPLIESGGGHVATVSSAFGLVAAPLYAAYSAAKFAVRGFTEALRQEMRAAGHPVAVTCVYPGGVRTPIMRSGTYAADADRAAVVARFDRTVARVEAPAAAAAILRGVRAGHAQVLVGADARLASLASRLTGPGYARILPLLRNLPRLRR
jgi:NAD(P)-dependent dehydrogenase (short-subunit alcohol dehydrogenase family)